MTTTPTPLPDAADDPLGCPRGMLNGLAIMAVVFVAAVAGWAVLA